MIDPATPVFPNNVVSLVQTSVQALDSDLVVYRRPLRVTDPSQGSVGIYGQQWLPEEDSYEMRGAPMGLHVPTLDQYLISVQAFVKDTDEERGLARHSVLSEMIRSMLYSDATLRVGLSALTTTVSNVTKRTKRWGVRQQRYFSNEIDASFLYLSTLEFWLETETV